MTHLLVTGGGGFVGQWVAKAFLSRGDSVDLTGLGEAPSDLGVLSLDERQRVRWFPADIRDSQDIDLVVERSRPEAVMHLAGVSFPPDADRSPTTAYDVNALGAVRLLNAIRRQRVAGVLDPVTLIVGSGMQYGEHPVGAMPLDETTPQFPVTMYAASKAAQEVASLQFWRGAGVRVICTRSFNHSGIGHGRQYLLPSLVRRARTVRSGAEPRLTLGNDVVRDYLHVSDVVEAYWLLLERGIPGEVYNVASGTGVSVRQLATDVLLRLGIHAEISTEPAFVRAGDIPILVGDSSKLTAATGWTPRKTHADIIDDLLHAATD